MLASLGNAEQTDITLCILRDGKQIATAGVGFALLWPNDNAVESLGIVKVGDRQISNLSLCSGKGTGGGLGSETGAGAKTSAGQNTSKAIRIRSAAFMGSGRF